MTDESSCNTRLAQEYYARARTAHQSGDVSSAIQWLQESLKVAPDFADGWIALGEVMKAHQEWDMAASAYLKAVEVKPDAAEAWAGLGWVLTEQGDHENGISAYQQSIQLNRSQTPVKYNLALELINSRKVLNETLELLQEVVSEQPSDHNAWNTLGFALHMSRRQDEAAEAYCRAIEIAPEIDDFKMNLLVAHYGIGTAHIKALAPNEDASNHGFTDNEIATMDEMCSMDTEEMVRRFF